MPFSSEEKRDMVRIYYISNRNSKYPERWQPHYSYFAKMNNNLAQYGGFVKPRVKYGKRIDPEEKQNIINTLGNKVLYAHQRFGPPVVSEKCYSATLFLKDFDIITNSLTSTFTFYDPREEERTRKIQLYVIGNAARQYTVYKKKEVTATRVIVTADYNVDLLCRDSVRTVTIETTKPERDEKIIQEATEAARKLMGTLPEPAVNLQCDELIPKS